MSVTITTAVVSVARLSSSGGLSSGSRLSLPLAVVAMVSVAVAMSVAMSIAVAMAVTVAVVAIAVAMSIAVTVAVAVAMAIVAIARLSQGAANKGERKNSQQLHDVFGSSFSETPPC